MRKILISALAITAMAASGAAQASILSNLLNFGQLNTLNDNSRGEIVDNDGDDVISDGDTIFGLFQIEKVNNTGDPSPGAIFAIYSITVNGAAFGPGGAGLSYIPTPASSTLSVQSLLDDALEPGVFSDIPAATWDNVLFAVLEVGAISAGINPFDASETGAPDTVITSNLTAANGWILDLLGGFDPTGTNQHGDTDFFETFFSATAPATTISGIRADDDGATVLTERAGMSVLHDTFGAGVEYNPVSVLKFSAAGTTDHDVVLRPDGAVQTSDLTNWDVEDDSNFRIHPTPEPGSIAVWALMAVFAIGAALRMRG